MTDTRNIVDKYKNNDFLKWTEEMIKDDLKCTNFPYAVMMENFAGDFTLGSVIRSANAFGASRVFYYGEKKYNKRGTVGTHLYSDIIHLSSIGAVQELKKDYTFVGLEIGLPSCQSIYNYVWPRKPLIILGEEGRGISKEVLDLCDSLVYIPQYGSVRSVNAAVAGSIAMNDYLTKLHASQNESSETRRKTYF